MGLIGFGTGSIQYGVAYIRCGGAPIAATRFMAAHSYSAPGDSNYAPSIFSEYYCSAAEAEEDGFRPSPLSEAGRRATEDLRMRLEEEGRFSPNKINYTLYVPVEKYTYGGIRVNEMSSGDIHTFYFIKEGDHSIASARAGSIPSDYQLCTSDRYDCVSIGKHKRGSEVVRQISGRRNDIVSYGVNIGGTFINLTQVDEEKKDVDIIDIFNSLGEYEND